MTPLGGSDSGGHLGGQRQLVRSRKMLVVGYGARRVRGDSLGVFVVGVMLHPFVSTRPRTVRPGGLALSTALHVALILAVLSPMRVAPRRASGDVALREATVAERIRYVERVAPPASRAPQSTARVTPQASPMSS